MISVAQRETTTLTDSLQSLVAAMAACSALAQSFADDLTGINGDAFERLEAQVQRQMDGLCAEMAATALAGSRAIPLASSYGDESAVAVATPSLLLTAFYLW